MWHTHTLDLYYWAAPPFPQTADTERARATLQLQLWKPETRPLIPAYSRSTSPRLYDINSSLSSWLSAAGTRQVRCAPHPPLTPSRRFKLQERAPKKHYSVAISTLYQRVWPKLDSYHLHFFYKLLFCKWCRIKFESCIIRYIMRFSKLVILPLICGISRFYIIIFNCNFTLSLVSHPSGGGKQLRHCALERESESFGYKLLITQRRLNQLLFECI